MKIRDIQFIGRAPMINGSMASLRLHKDIKAGVKDIQIDGDMVRVDLANGQFLLIPGASVYITAEADDVASKKVTTKAA